MEEKSSNFSAWRFSVAPMMEWTDRHYRALARLHSRHARLYSEMVTTAAILHGDRERLLGHDAGEHPLAVQLGGSDPADLARAARIAPNFPMPRSISMSAARPTACRMALSAPA